MNLLPKFLSDPKNRKSAIILFSVGLLLIAAGLIYGINNNLPGIGICYAGIVVLMLAFVRHWQSAKRYLSLFIISLISFPVFAILHNLFDGLALIAKENAILFEVLNFLSALWFILAVLVSPPGVAIGLAGSLFYYIKNREITEV